MSVNENIKFYRKQKKISQRELGRRIKKSGQLISLIEQGKTTPSIDTINKIALALDISADKLLLEPSSNIYISPSEKIKSSIHSLIESITENEINNSKFKDSNEITEDLLKAAADIYKNNKTNKTTYVIPKDNGNITYKEAILGITKYINYLANEENYVVGSEDYGEIIKSAEELVRGKILIAKKNRGEKIK